jgi:Ca2+-binding EF-hand superfamily protein
MCKKREIVLEQAFRRLDVSCSGYIDVNDLKYWYKLNKFNNYDEERIEEVFI